MVFTSSREFFANHSEREKTYALSDNVSPAEFEEALAEARGEGNVSRARA